jgi:hypothetical protein
MQPFDWFSRVILPLIVFLARVIDVGLGTMRIIFISRGKRVLAALLGFVEVFVWITDSTPARGRIWGHTRTWTGRQRSREAQLQSSIQKGMITRGEHHPA